MPAQTTLIDSKIPSRSDHLLNVAVILLLLADIWMVGSIIEMDYDEMLFRRTDPINGDGLMASKEAFWFWVDNYLVAWLIVIVPSYLALAFVHAPRFFKKPSLVNEVVFAIEGFALLNIFPLIIFLF